LPRWAYTALLVVLILASAVYLIYVKQSRTPAPEEQAGEQPLLKLEEVSSVIITIVYDNNPFNPQLQTAWGFSCFVDVDGEKLLFDTGGNPQILLENMRKLNITPDEISIIVLSHIHGDHTGGLLGLLEAMKNPSKVEVYLPASFPKSLKEEIKNRGPKIIEVKEPTKIRKAIATTGEMGRTIKEQALIINTQKGIIIITGCAHPGVAEMAEKAKNLTGRPILLVLGGYHLAGESPQKIQQIAQKLKQLGAQKVAPCHCTGETAKTILKNQYRQNYIEVGVGKTIKITA